MAQYKVTSAKEGNEAEAIVVDGDYVEGGRRAAVGEEIELSDDEFEVLSGLFDLEKVGGSGSAFTTGSQVQKPEDE